MDKPGDSVVVMTWELGCIGQVGNMFSRWCLELCAHMTLSGTDWRLNIRLQVWPDGSEINDLRNYPEASISYISLHGMLGWTGPLGLLEKACVLDLQGTVTEDELSDWDLPGMECWFKPDSAQVILGFASRIGPFLSLLVLEPVSTGWSSSGQTQRFYSQGTDGGCVSRC